ncbi:MAG: DUF4878 domain-containing protein [Akkermansiaceae bacterium]|nr:DUF4878 domain-containing protein [Akkermansiaceae bacterium]
MKTLLSLTALCTTLLSAETPSEVLRQFKKSAQAKDFDATWAHTAKFEGQPKVLTDYFKEEIRDFIELTNMGWDFEIREEKVEGDCAVIVINEHKKNGVDSFDLDPIYLIKQGDQWKVLPELTNWDEAKRGMKDQVAILEKLELWFNRRKAEIKKAENP